MKIKLCCHKCWVKMKLKRCVGHEFGGHKTTYWVKTLKQVSTPQSRLRVPSQESGTEGPGCDNIGRHEANAVSLMTGVSDKNTESDHGIMRRFGGQNRGGQDNQD